MLNNIKEEYRKCVDDPVYFAEHHCYILKENGNKSRMKLTNAQKEYLRKLSCKYKEMD